MVVKEEHASFVNMLQYFTDSFDEPGAIIMVLKLVIHFAISFRWYTLPKFRMEISLQFVYAVYISAVVDC